MVARGGPWNDGLGWTVWWAVWWSDLLLGGVELSLERNLLLVALGSDGGELGGGVG